MKPLNPTSQQVFAGLFHIMLESNEKNNQSMGSTGGIELYFHHSQTFVHIYSENFRGFQCKLKIHNILAENAKKNALYSNIDTKGAQLSKGKF